MILGISDCKVGEYRIAAAAVGLQGIRTVQYDTCVAESVVFLCFADGVNLIDVGGIPQCYTITSAGWRYRREK